MQHHDKRAGIFSAIAAYLMWGLAPIYFKLLQDISADEIMVHRVVWSTVLLLVIVMTAQKWSAFINTIKSPRFSARLFLSASFLGVNWFLFIWAVNNDHILDASLGYFINPLLSVALGVIFLSERLSQWKIVAIGLALVGVLIQVISLGSLPVISLALAGTFAIYGLLRKKLGVDSFIGLLIESLWMLPLATGYWLLSLDTTTSNMTNNAFSLNLTLIFAGVVTTAPLLCFTAAANRLNLSTVGFFQYIAPSIMFLLAIFHYQETLQPAKLLTFGCIWLGLIIFTLDSFNSHRRQKLASDITRES